MNRSTRLWLCAAVFAVVFAQLASAPNNERCFRAWSKLHADEIAGTATDRQRARVERLCR